MTITAQSKAETIGEYALGQGDTGSPEVQVALLTDRIKDLTEHFKKNKNDRHSTRGLLKAVNQRKRLLEYLKNKNSESYQNVLTKLKLRK